MNKVFTSGQGTLHNWQCDHMGHVNIRAYGELFEQSIWHAFNHIGITPSLLRRGEVAMATVEQNIRYLKELHAGDVVTIQSYVARVTHKVVTFEKKLYNAETNELCATCTIVAVCLDAISRKSRPLPDEIYHNATAMVFQPAEK